MNGAQHKVVGIGWGIAGACILASTADAPYAIVVAATSVVGSMLPDIDHDKTKIGRKRKFLTNLTTTVANIVVFGGIVAGLIAFALMLKGFIDFGVSSWKILVFVAGLILVAIVKKVIGGSKIFKWATKHRGLMHTLVVPALLFIGMKASSFPLYHYGIMGILIGYMSHLFADMLTVEGCPVLFPLTRNNVAFPTRYKTKDKVCTRAAYFVAVLSVGLAYVYVRLFR